MRLELGKTTYFEGFKATFVIDEKPKKIKPGSTAEHEAMHVVGALNNGTGVEMASIVPGPGFNGITKLSKPDAVSAMAPHSMGAEGTGWDVFIASQIGSAGAESAARSIIMSHRDEVEAVAIALEEKKTVISSDIRTAIYEMHNPLPESGIIFIETENGESIKENVEVRDNIVLNKESIKARFEEISKKNVRGLD